MFGVGLSVLAAALTLPAIAQDRAAPSARASENAPAVERTVEPVWTPVPIPEQVGVVEGFADAGGVRLWYWDTGGDGEVLLLSHPGSQSSLIWQYQQPYFAKAGYRVIAYSRRGHYRSEHGPANDPGTTVADLANLLDHLDVDRVHLLGAAAGGITAMAFAIAHPERTRSLILAGSIVSPDEDEWRDMFGRLEMAEARQHMSAAFLELSASYRAGNPAGTELFEHRSTQGRTNGPVSQPSGVSVKWNVMENLQTPVLLLTGEADLYSPPSLQRLFAQHLRNYELAVVPESAHAVYWEQPGQFNRIVLDFLRRQRASD